MNRSTTAAPLSHPEQGGGGRMPLLQRSAASRQNTKGPTPLTKSASAPRRASLSLSGPAPGQGNSNQQIPQHANAGAGTGAPPPTLVLPPASVPVQHHSVTMQTDRQGANPQRALLLPNQSPGLSPSPENSASAMRRRSSTYAAFGSNDLQASGVQGGGRRGSVVAPGGRRGSMHGALQQGLPRRKSRQQRHSRNSIISMNGGGEDTVVTRTMHSMLESLGRTDALLVEHEQWEARMRQLEEENAGFEEQAKEASKALEPPQRRRQAQISRLLKDLARTFNSNARRQSTEVHGHGGRRASLTGGSLIGGVETKSSQSPEEANENDQNVLELISNVEENSDRVGLLLKRLEKLVGTFTDVCEQNQPDPEAAARQEREKMSKRRSKYTQSDPMITMMGMREKKDGEEDALGDDDAQFLDKLKTIRDDNRSVLLEKNKRGADAPDAHLRIFTKGHLELAVRRRQAELEQKIQEMEESKRACEELRSKLIGSPIVRCVIDSPTVAFSMPSSEALLLSEGAGAPVHQATIEGPVDVVNDCLTRLTLLSSPSKSTRAPSGDSPSPDSSSASASSAAAAAGVASPSPTSKRGGGGGTPKRRETGVGEAVGETADSAAKRVPVSESSGNGNVAPPEGVKMVPFSVSFQVIGLDGLPSRYAHPAHLLPVPAPLDSDTDLSNASSGSEYEGSPLTAGALNRTGGGKSRGRRLWGKLKRAQTAGALKMRFPPSPSLASAGVEGETPANNGGRNDEAVALGGKKESGSKEEGQVVKLQRVRLDWIHDVWLGWGIGGGSSHSPLYFSQANALQSKLLHAFQRSPETQFMAPLLPHICALYLVDALAAMHRDLLRELGTTTALPIIKRNRKKGSKMQLGGRGTPGVFSDGGVEADEESRRNAQQRARAALKSSASLNSSKGAVSIASQKLLKHFASVVQKRAGGASGGGPMEEEEEAKGGEAAEGGGNFDFHRPKVTAERYLKILLRKNREALTKLAIGHDLFASPDLPSYCGYCSLHWIREYGFMVSSFTQVVDALADFRDDIRETWLFYSLRTLKNMTDEVKMPFANFWFFLQDVGAGKFRLSEKQIQEDWAAQVPPPDPPQRTEMEALLPKRKGGELAATEKGDGGGERGRQSRTGLLQALKQSKQLATFDNVQDGGARTVLLDMPAAKKIFLEVLHCGFHHKRGNKRSLDSFHKLPAFPYEVSLCDRVLYLWDTKRQFSLQEFLLAIVRVALEVVKPDHLDPGAKVRLFLTNNLARRAKRLVGLVVTRQLSLVPVRIVVDKYRETLMKIFNQSARRGWDQGPQMSMQSVLVFLGHIGIRHLLPFPLLAELLLCYRVGDISRLSFLPFFVDLLQPQRNPSLQSNSNEHQEEDGEGDGTQRVFSTSPTVGRLKPKVQNNNSILVDRGRGQSLSAAAGTDGDKGGNFPLESLTLNNQRGTEGTAVEVPSKETTQQSDGEKKNKKKKALSIVLPDRGPPLTFMMPPLTHLDFPEVLSLIGMLPFCNETSPDTIAKGLDQFLVHFVLKRGREPFKAPQAGEESTEKSPAEKEKEKEKEAATRAGSPSPASPQGRNSPSAAAAAAAAAETPERVMLRELEAEELEEGEKDEQERKNLATRTHINSLGRVTGQKEQTEEEVWILRFEKSLHTDFQRVRVNPKRVFL